MTSSAGQRNGAVNHAFADVFPEPAERQRFIDRRDAGRRMAAVLDRFRDDDPVVVGIPRGGVPVAAEVARALGAPLDVVLVRKIGAPHNPEFAIGAVGEDDVILIDPDVVRALGIAQPQLQALVSRGRAEVDERAGRFRPERAAVPVVDRTVLLVDDGLATGSTAQAAARVLRHRGASHVVLAVPVGAAQALERLRDDFDDVVCVEAPSDLVAVGLWYADFTPTTDDEVVRLLRSAAGRSLRVEVDGGAGVTLAGDLNVPNDPLGVVVFAHGSGSSRHSPRNRMVADHLVEAGLATLLFDLLTPDEARDRGNVFDIALLAGRLASATEWLRDRSDVGALPIGYFGASTGAAAALIAAAALSEDVWAVVCRGGRPDLAEPRLSEVTAPTLLIVGERDDLVIELNRNAQRQLRCPNRLILVPRATHLFEQAGALETVADLARDWLIEHLAAHQRAGTRG